MACPLDVSEVRIGLVAYFDQLMLEKNPSVQKSLPQVDATSEARPFVCFAIEGGFQHWAPLTTVY